MVKTSYIYCKLADCESSKKQTGERFFTNKQLIFLRFYKKIITAKETHAKT